MKKDSYISRGEAHPDRSDQNSTESRHDDCRQQSETHQIHRCASQEREAETNSDRLRELGWDEFFQASFQAYVESGYVPGRVSLEHKNSYQVYTAGGELLAQVSGKARYEAAGREQLPAVGDWVAVRPRYAENRATIHAILPRKSEFARKVAGARTEQQIVGANIDEVFLMTSLNQDFNLRRIERYLALAWESKASPVIVLSKADLCREIDEKLAQVEAIAAGVPAHVISVFDEQGLGALDHRFRVGRTVALLGSSGVGKSTLINHLVGREIQKVRAIRQHDDRGRHATTHRQLIALPRGGLILDTPGMRELQLWNGQSGLDLAFDDIESLAARCYYRDCQHNLEPRCAVREALEREAVDPARYRNYEKLKKETRYLELKQDQRAQRAEKQKWKKLTRMASKRADMKRRGY